jgi:hypothetical protein
MQLSFFLIFFVTLFPIALVYFMGKRRLGSMYWPLLVCLFALGVFGWNILEEPVFPETFGHDQITKPPPDLTEKATQQTQKLVEPENKTLLENDDPLLETSTVDTDLTLDELTV